MGPKDTTPVLLGKHLGIKELNELIGCFDNTNDEIKIEWRDENNDPQSQIIELCDDDIRTIQLNAPSGKEFMGLDVESLKLTTILETFQNSIFKELKGLIQKNSKPNGELFLADSMAPEPQEKMQRMFLKLFSSGASSYIIVPAKAGAAFHDNRFFTFEPMERDFKTNMNLYRIGKLANVDIWVDPYASWDKNEAYAGTKVFTGFSKGIYFAYNSHYFEADLDSGIAKIKYRMGFINDETPDFKSIKLEYAQD